MAELHRLLHRQLRRLGVDPTTPPAAEDWARVLEVVGQHYDHADADRQLMARSMRISSDEMLVLQRELKQEHAKLVGVVGLVGEVLGSLHLLVDGREAAAGEIDSALVLNDAKRSLAAQLKALLGDDGGSAKTQQILGDLLYLADQVHAMMIESATQAVLRKEVEFASAVQSLLLPQEDTFVQDRVALAGFLRPAGLCSGDWWSVDRLDAHHVLAVLGDITGHGIASALITGVAKAACDMACMGGTLHDPAELLSIMNRCISRAARGTLYMTCAAAIFDTQNARVQISSAGHPAPVLIRTREGRREVLSLQAPSDPLGWEATTTYDTHVVDVEPGDVFVWFTDGLVECEDARGRALGSRRLMNWLRSAPSMRPPMLRDYLIEHVTAHHGACALADDMALLVAEIS